MRLSIPEIFAASKSSDGFKKNGPLAKRIENRSSQRIEKIFYTEKGLHCEDSVGKSFRGTKSEVVAIIEDNKDFLICVSDPETGNEKRYQISQKNILWVEYFD